MNAAVLVLLLHCAAAARAPVAIEAQSTSPTLGCSLLSLESSVKSAALRDVEEHGEFKHRPSLRGRGLLQIGAQTAAATANEGAQQRADVERGPFSAGWFGDFSQGESTFRTDGLDSRPSFPERHEEQNDFYPPEVGDAGVAAAKPDTWFQETESGGAERAWQTYFPAVGNFRSREQKLAPWRGTASGTFQELYKPDEKVEELAASTETKTASWFDSSVSQYDAFGRGKLPSKESNERYVEWERRSRRANISCADPGCEANASLKLFDHAREAHEDCKLSVHVHPTDFDDDFSREYVELVHVNGRTLDVRCHPKASAQGCAEEALLQPCIEGYSLDGLVGKDGHLELTARISPMVDECPVDGWLLSGEIVVDCLVHPSWLAPPPPQPEEDRWTTTTAPARGAKLQCSEPGCIATTTVLLEEEDLANKTCRLTVTMVQTDFDSDHGTNEEVEWVKVAGTIIREHAKPGGNPCTGAGGDVADPASGSIALAARGNASNTKANPGSGAATAANSSNGTGSGAAAGTGSDATTGGKPGSNGSNATAGSKATGGKPGGNGSAAGNGTASPSSGSNATAGKPGSNGTAAGNGTTSSGNGSNATAGKPGSNGTAAGNGTTSSGNGSGSNTTTVKPGSNGSTTIRPATTTAGPGSGANPRSNATTKGPGSGNATTASPGSNSSSNGTTKGPSAGNATTAMPSTTASPGTTTAGRGSGAGMGNQTESSFLGSTTEAPDDASGTSPNPGGGILGGALGGGGSVSGSAGSVVEDQRRLEGWRYVLLNGTDVTQAAQDGHVEVSAKISAMVDECGSDGFLLDAEAIIECS